MGTGSQQAPTIVVPIGTVVQRDSFGSRMLDGVFCHVDFPDQKSTPAVYTQRRSVLSGWDFCYQGPRRGGARPSPRGNGFSSSTKCK